MTGFRMVRRAAGATLTLCCLAAAAGCGSSSSGLPKLELLGAGTAVPLNLERVPVTSEVKVPEAAARKLVEHPMSAPQLDGGVRQFGLARVTTKALLAAGPGTPSFADGRLAWVGIYEVSKDGSHSCPAQPMRLPAKLPPVFDHYYFAVIVDAATGSEVTWMQDMSGLLLRDCAGVPTR